MAARLGVDEETVRRRVTRLRKEQIIRNFVLLLNPHLLDLDCAALYLELHDAVTKKQAISKIKFMDGIVSILSLHQTGLLVILYYEADEALGRLVSLIESICEAKATMFWKIPFPEYDRDLSKTDWMIINSLRKDPRKKLSDLASELRCSTRTLNRRIARLNDGNAFFLELEVNLMKAGGFPYLLLVHCKDPAKKREIDKEIMSGLKRLGYSDTLATNHSVFAVACDNISEANSISDRIWKINGVSDLRAGILEDRIFVEHWINEEIQKRSAK